MNIKKELNKAKYDLTTEQVELLVELFEGEIEKVIEEIKEEILKRKESYTDEDQSGNDLKFLDWHVSWLITYLNSKGGAK